jgi:hypothetical protein
MQFLQKFLDIEGKQSILHFTDIVYNSQGNIELSIIWKMNTERGRVGCL